MNNYLYYSTYFDKELLRMKTILLNDKSIDYKLVNKSGTTHVRAPLSGYFEIEIHISEKDFEKAEKILNGVDE